MFRTGSKSAVMSGSGGGVVPSVTRLITRWYKRTQPSGEGTAVCGGSTVQTAILDYRSAEIVRLVERARVAAHADNALAVVEAAHGIIRDEVRAVYALAEETPASRTFARGFGSCSQRLAILESVARSIGVPTRVRALLIDRAFWYPRFPRIGGLLPDRIMLVWPEFHVGEWRSAGELFGAVGCRGGSAFTNNGAETLFEAAGRCAVDWDGRTDGGEFDLSRFVRADFGYFTDRDEAFARRGQALCAPSRLVADPILRRIAA